MHPLFLAVARRPTARPLAMLLLLLLLNLPPGGGHRGCAAAPPALRRQFFALLRAGDSVYAQKANEWSFARSLTYYDRALALAQAQPAADTLLLAEAIFAKGRVYDAWNQEPTRTVATFQQAADLFRRLPGQYVRYLYVQHLVAHAYDKVPDSTRAVGVLRRLYAELRGQPDTLLRRVPFAVEMALTATEVRNYPLADSLLRQLTRRAWIRNDPATLDHLSHYYLVRARLAVLGTGDATTTAATPYLDSLTEAYQQAQNPYDRLYYAQNLARLHYAAGNFRTAYDFQHTATNLDDDIVAGGHASQIRQALVRSEERAAVRHRRYEAAARAARRLVLGLLSGGLLVISLLTFRLYRQRQTSRGQAARLVVVNHALDAHVVQVELLNKEMHHRVKNNLQMIFSLLQMQERRTDDAAVIEHLQTARLRVESIAALHHQLLGSPDALDLSTYLRGLIASVVNCLANDRPVVTHLQIDALRLAKEAYLPLSLMLNEWVTNSVKYAAPPAGEALEIRVSVRTCPQQVYLTYADNGRAPEPTSAPRPAGLGLEIIDLLGRQLDATLRTAPDHPYHYELTMSNDK